MNRSLQEYTNKAKKDVVVHYNKSRQLLTMKEFELIKAELNRQHQLNVKKVDLNHLRSMRRQETEAQIDNQGDERRFVELSYIDADVLDELRAQRTELIMKLQALLKTEPGIQKLASLMNDAAFRAKLYELLPEICDQLCEVFQIDPMSQYSNNL